MDEDRVAEARRALLERQQARQEELQTRREARLGAQDPNESAQAFFDVFRDRRAAIDTEITAAKPLARSELPAAFDAIANKVAELQRYLSDSVRFLPSYDVQQAQKQVDSARAALDTAQDELMPKKKFAFKSRRQKTGDGASKKTRADISSAAVPSATLAAVDKLEISGRSGETIRLLKEDVQGKDVEIRGLAKCRVELAGQPAAFHMRDLTGCTILIGPVSRSLLIHGCKQCRFWIACQQLRVHTTVDTDFYLHVTSKAIIEDCERVRFAPYSWHYDGIAVDYAESGLRQDRNSWDNVDDFKWLNPNQPSPNWSILPEADRVLPDS